MCVLMLSLFSLQSLLCSRKLDQEISSADISASGDLVAAGLHNGEFLVLNFADLSVVTQKRDRSKKIQAIRYVVFANNYLLLLLYIISSSRFSPNGKLLAVGSDDACVDIYSLESLDKRGPSRTSYCRGIPSYVTHIDWCKDSRYLQVGGAK